MEKPVDRRNRFLEEDNIFFVAAADARARARRFQFFFPRDNKNSPAELRDLLLELGCLIFPKSCLDKSPVASLRFFSRANSLLAVLPFPLAHTSIWIGRLNRPVPVASPMTLIAHKLIDKSFRVFDRQSLILSMFSLKR